MFCQINGDGRGIAKVLERDDTDLVIEFFDHPSNGGRVIERTRSRVNPKRLGKNVRVYTFNDVGGEWAVARVREDDGRGVEVRYPGRIDAYLPYESVFVRWARPLTNPMFFLKNFISETPLFAEARSGFLRSYLDQCRSSFGISALLSSSIELETHQIDVVRRVLNDPSQRYLLADEVGLGKTIEAGVIIRQAVLDDPKNHRIVILVPRPLIYQWRSELKSRFALDIFIDESVFVFAHEDSDSLREALNGATMLVIDEAHRLADSFAEESILELYSSIASDAAQVEKLLLLSATPILRNETGFLRMLHLLDSVVYPLNSTERFKAKIRHRQVLAECTASLEPTNMLVLDDTISKLSELFPNDERMSRLNSELSTKLASLPDEDDEEFLSQLNGLRAHISETYKLSRRILRNRRKRVVGLTPDRDGATSWFVENSGASLFEERLEEWRVYLTGHSLSASPVFRETTRTFYFELIKLYFDQPDQLSPLIASRIESIKRGELLSIGDEQSYLEKILGEVNPENWLESKIHTLERELALLPKEMKIVVFASSMGLADFIFSELQARNFGVVRSQTNFDIDYADRPDSASKFQRYALAQILICDRESEEGLNLQGGEKTLIHFDLPLQPNRIEQRIGRLDRYGSGNAIHSFLLVDCESSLQETWSKVLSEGFEVFSRSISTLQYLVEDELNELRTGFFEYGIESLQDLLAKLSGPKGLVASEFKRLDQQDALDELAPYAEDDLDELFEIDADWRLIQESMLRWIVGTLMFEQVFNSSDGSKTSTSPVFRLDYKVPTDRSRQATLIPISDYTGSFLGAIDYEAPGNSSSSPKSHKFSVYRQTAVNKGVRPLRYGSEFVDSVKRFSDSDDRGRCFAIWRKVREGIESDYWGCFFRFDFLIQTNLDPAKTILVEKNGIESRGWFSTLGRRGVDLFPPMLDTVWLDSDGEEVEPSFAEQFLTPRYKKEGFDDYIDKNLDSASFRKLALETPDFFSTWDERCERLEIAATSIVLNRLDLRNRQKFAERRLKERDQIRFEQLMTRIQMLPDDEASDEQSRLNLEKKISEALIMGVHSPSVTIDVVGVIILSRNNISG